MKKTLTILLCALIAAAAIYAIYCYGFRKKPLTGTAEEQVVQILRQNDCYVCHSQNPKLPFYAKFPIIKGMMDRHVQHAVDFTDLEAKTTQLDSIDEVTLSMIDHAVAYNTMPITEYKLVHWGTTFNRKEKNVLTKWILDKRGGYGEPVRPIPATMEVDSAKVNLGERLFNDARISLDGNITCATCHLLESGGADKPENRLSIGIDGLKGTVNAPSVYNAVFNAWQFWNGRALDLREQAEGPATNPVEMGDQTMDQIWARLYEDKDLVKEFESLYPGQGMTPFTITNAIAEFEKTLITPDSRFDQYLAGDKNALTAQEVQGYEDFKKNSCATCHVGVALGGQTFEKLGIFGDYFGDRNPEIEYNSDDDGLKGFTHKEEDIHKFKVPNLRNVARTPPYFHDGQYQTMEEAVRAMATYELGKDLPEKEVSSIVAFMKSLNGKNVHLAEEAE